MKYLILLWLSGPLTWYYLFQNADAPNSEAPFLTLYSIFGAPYVFAFTTIAILGLGGTKIMKGMIK